MNTINFIHNELMSRNLYKRLYQDAKTSAFLVGIGLIAASTGIISSENFTPYTAYFYFLTLYSVRTLEFLYISKFRSAAPIFTALLNYLHGATLTFSIVSFFTYFTNPFATRASHSPYLLISIASASILLAAFRTTSDNPKIKPDKQTKSDRLYYLLMGVGMCFAGLIGALSALTI